MPSVHENLKELTGKEIPLEEGDIRDIDFIGEVFSRHDFYGVIHLAAKKAVGESVRKPLLYFDVNVNGLISLLKVIKEYPIKTFIFSSSCTVYGSPEKLPVTENTPTGFTPSPYGKTKQICEGILESVKKNEKYDVISLRYFNPVGAHSSAKIGELPKGVPNNLVPFITQTAVGMRDELKVFGGDYDTPDGSAIRDYIHVVDLAKAHVRALELNNPEYLALNIGTGQGYSVLEVVEAFNRVAGVQLKYRIVERRKGDLPVIYGDTTLSVEKLGWKTEKGLDEMLEDAWRWQVSLQA